MTPLLYLVIQIFSANRSGAENALLARNPHDVSNLGQLIGLTQEQSIRAVSDTPLAVLRRAEARKGR